MITSYIIKERTGSLSVNNEEGKKAVFNHYNTKSRYGFDLSSEQLEVVVYGIKSILVIIECTKEGFYLYNYPTNFGQINIYGCTWEEANLKDISNERKVNVYKTLIKQFIYNISFMDLYKLTHRNRESILAVLDRMDSSVISTIFLSKNGRIEVKDDGYVLYKGSKSLVKVKSIARISRNMLKTFGIF